MAKSFVIVLVATFIISREVLLSTAAPASDETIQEWLLTFDPSKTPASRTSTCLSKPNGLYPDNEPDTCTSNYFACVGGTQYKQGPCPSPTVWDVSAPGAGSCTELAAAKSDACKKPVTFPPPSCTSPGIQDGVFQPTAACSSLYYFCVQGQIYFQSCISDKVFDSVLRSCNGTTNVTGCTPTDAVTTAPPTDVTVPPFTCSGKKPGSFYALGICTPNYYNCSGDAAQPLLAACEGGKVFNYTGAPFNATTVAASCILSASASGCQSTAAPATSTTKKPYSCPASSGTFSIPGTTGANCCNNYYSCSGSVANKVNCPSGYYFESSKSACISKTSASSSCQQKPIITCTY